MMAGVYGAGRNPQRCIERKHNERGEGTMSSIVPNWATYPGRDWEEITPEEAGLDAEGFGRWVGGMDVRGASFGGEDHSGNRFGPFWNYGNVVAVVKATFSLDPKTVGLLADAARRLAKPKSEIVRGAIRDYCARIGRLSEEERLRLLADVSMFSPF